MIWPMYRTLVGAAIISGAVLATTFELTREPILVQQRAALSAAVLAVLPTATRYQAYRFDPESGLSNADDDLLASNCFTGFDATGKLVGHAIAAAGMGYQDRVSLLYGLGPDAQTITRLRVLANRETPGLGSKIATDAGFLNQFQGLSLDHPIEAVRAGRRQHPWQIDTITGATISSRTVARLINDSASPTLIQKLEERSRG